MMAFYSRHKSHFKAGLLAVLAVLYAVYFGYAISYEFGDEGSVRLVWITCLVVVILTLKLIRRRLCPQLQLTSSSHPLNYIHQHHRQINWLVLWLVIYFIIIIIIFIVIIALAMSGCATAAPSATPFSSMSSTSSPVSTCSRNV